MWRADDASFVANQNKHFALIALIAFMASIALIGFPLYSFYALIAFMPWINGSSARQLISKHSV